MQTRSHLRSRDGIALIMVLAFIVLLTILIVSFIAYERLNRVSTASYSRSIQAQEIAQGGIQDILGDLHSEIIAGSTVYNTNSSGTAYTNSYAAAYIPTTNLTAVPARVGYANSSYGTDSSTTTLSPTLIRVSRATGNPNAVSGDSFFTNIVASVGNYTNNPTLIPGGKILNRASMASTTNFYEGGRYISAARWNKSYLLATNSATVPAPFTTAAPDWVYVTRTGSRVCATSELASLKPSTTLAANYGAVTPGVNPPASPVVGRYAFVMYDEGALLDANMAGYTHQSTNLVSSPADPTTGITQAVNGKSYLAYADLTQLPGLSGNQATVDNFVSWRNASAISTGNTYLLALINYSKSGFLNFASGDSPLLGRQDLINYFASIDSHINTSSATFSKALPYLGTFSRAVSAPSWTPTADSQNMPNYVAGLGTSVAYKTNAEKTGSANRDLANVRFPVAGTVTHYGDNATVSPTPTYTVNIGDPLLQNRFSLAKIDWLSQADPVAGTAPSATYATAIQACFGLVWGSPGSTTTNSSTSTSTANGGNPCWNYVGSPAGTGGTLAAFNGTIETLDQVAKEAREPNFFELLKAAILSGSVGLGGGPATFQNGNPAIGGIIVNGVNKYGGSDIPYDYTDEPGQYWQYRAGVGGLFSYSLGYARTTTGPFGPAQFPDVQIIQIGANIVDQFDADSYPTAIYFPYGNYTSPAGQTYTGIWHSTLDPVYGNGTSVSASGPCALFGPLSMVYGDENLPLLHRIYGTVASPNRTSTSEPPQTSDNDVHTLEGWLQPQIWNPHQQPSATAPANAPVNFEIRAYGSAATYCDESNEPLQDPADPPPGWSNYPLNPPVTAVAWPFEQSSFVTYYPGASSTEDPTKLSANGGGREGTLAFTIDPTKFPFCDTPRLLTTDNLPGVTVDTTQGLPQTPTSPSTEPESSYTQNTFPGYITPQYNGNSAYPSGFNNHFAAFSTGDITGTYNGILTPSPYNAYFVNTSLTRGAPAFYAAGSYPSNGVSFALGWYPAGQSPTASNFHPYSFITGIFATSGLRMNTGSNTVVGYVQTNNVMSPLDWGSLDPRTSRFTNTLGCEVSEQSYNYNEPGNNTIFGKNDQYAAFTIAGVPYNGNFVTPLPTGSYGQNNYQGMIQGWISNVTSPLLAVVKPTNAIPTFYPTSGVPTTSVPVTTPAAYAAPVNTPAYYADPDGVVRPADGAYPTPGTGDGIMTFVNDGTPQANGNAVSATDKSGSAFPNGVQHGRRPVILNRPFRSVGELGYVFRDEPFKTLDFFSKSSADAALLDVFSLTDESIVSSEGQIGSVVAGQFNPSNAPVPVIQAVLAGGSKKDADATYNVSTEAATIAKNCVAALNPTGATPNPLMNRAALATQLMPSALTAMRATTSFNSGDMSNKTYFEAPVRALGDVTNTRTWNLLIDIIAQSGQISPSAATLNDFVVQGERRYWLHIAIDRYTGKIIDQQLEPVYE